MVYQGDKKKEKERVKIHMVETVYFINRKMGSKGQSLWMYIYEDVRTGGFVHFGGVFIGEKIDRI